MIAPATAWSVLTGLSSIGVPARRSPPPDSSPRRRRRTGATLAVVSTEISQRELRNNSGDIMRRLDEGEIFVVTRNGVPVGELTPVRRRRVVNGPALNQAFSAAPRIDYARLRADLDSIADQDITARG